MISYETLLDAAAQHFERIGNSPNRTRPARNLARGLAREVRAELERHVRSCPALRCAGDTCVTDMAPAWTDDDPAPLRIAA